jgi:FlaA1/EpsC-like NDP-sugar epimerase
MYLSGPHSPFTRRLSPNPSRSIQHDALVLSAGFLRAFDVASVPASELFAHYFRYGSIDVDLTRAVLVPLGMIFLANAMALFRAYDHDALANPRTQVSKVVAAWATAFAMLLVIAFFEKISVYYSRLWVGYWFCIGVSFSLGARFALSAYLDRLKRAGRLTVDIAIVGRPPFVHKVMQRLTRPNDVDVRVVGVFEPNIGGVCEDSTSQGTVDDLINFARQRRIHEIIVHLPERRDDAFYAMLQKLGELPVNVNLCPDLSDLPIPPRKFTVLREAVMINVYERPLSGWSAILKRLEDIVLSALLLLFFLPLMAVVAALIKLDSGGPVFFRQLRFGFNNNPISVYKFRTMHADAARDPTAQ